MEPTDPFQDGPQPPTTPGRNDNQDPTNDPFFKDFQIPQTPEILLDIAKNKPLGFISWLNQVCQRGTSLTEQVKQLLADKNTLLQQIQALDQELQARGDDVVNTLREINLLKSKHKSEKLPDPPVFNGDPEKLRPFIGALLLKVRGNADHFPTDESQLCYAISRLEGSAYKSMQSIITPEGIALNNVNEFVAKLKMIYKGPDYRVMILQKLDALRQKNRTFVDFFCEFEEYLNEANQEGTWVDEVKINYLNRSLSLELRSLLVTTVNPPTTYPEYVKMLRILDERHRAASKSPFNANRSTTGNNRFVKTNHTPPTTTHTVTDTVTTAPQDPDAMGLSQVINRTQGARKGPLSATERERRMRKGLCLYCGNPGHMKFNCPAQRLSPIGFR